MAVLSIDQGTTGTTAVLVNANGYIIKRAYSEFPQIYPQPGWVEHDPQVIWSTVVETVNEVCAGHTGEILAVGITNQRETTVLWDKTTGEPLHNAIVWQCRRTAGLCEQLREHEDLIRARTGLPLDAYFSGTKIRWLLDHLDDVDIDNTCFGTIDSWLIWNLTGGAVHATDFTNAARTLLFNIHERAWDETLCGLLQVPRAILPEARDSIGEFGNITTIDRLQGIPILGVAGDQQAALFGQACFERGQLKNTYGTGCFVVMNTGDEPVESKHGLITTLAVAGDGHSCYALEGSIFMGGATIQWLRDEMRILDHASDSVAMARAVPDNDGVYLVPAHVGLGAPHWDMQARGILTGLTRGTNRNHIVRAALEAMAYQTADVIRIMEAETGQQDDTLAVDGGACANDVLLQFQADILNCTVVRPVLIESTALGAAWMAGLKAGLWRDAEELAGLRDIESTFKPDMDATQREQLLEGWHRAVQQCISTN